MHISGPEAGLVADPGSVGAASAFLDSLAAVANPRRTQATHHPLLLCRPGTQLWMCRLQGLCRILVLGLQLLLLLPRHRQARRLVMRCHTASRQSHQGSRDPRHRRPLRGRRRHSVDQSRWQRLGRWGRSSVAGLCLDAATVHCCRCCRRRRCRYRRCRRHRHRRRWSAARVARADALEARRMRDVALAACGCMLCSRWLHALACAWSLARVPARPA